MLITNKRNYLPVTTALSTIVFILAAIGMQLYWNKDHYFAMMRAKALFLLPIALVCIITLIVWGIEYSKNRKYMEKRCSFSLLDAAVALYAVSALVTVLLSPIPSKAFNGEMGMMCGSFLYITGALIYFIVSRNMRPTKWVTATLLGVWAVIFLWSILNQMGIDLFDLHKNMLPNEVRGYLASFGNTNAGSDCFCLILPVGIILYMFAGNEKLIKWLRLFIVMGAFAGLCLQTEGILFGMMFLVPFLVMIAFAGSEKTDRLLEVVLMVAIALVIFHWTSVARGVKGLSIAMKIASCYVGEGLLLAATAVIMMRKRGQLLCDDAVSMKIGRWVTLFFVAVVVVTVIFFVSYSINHPMFGNTRGAIWKGSVWAFRLYSPKELIFGQGSGFYADNVTLAFSMLMEKPADLRYATCHDSLLQALLSQGIFGLLCYLTGIVALMRCWFKDLKSIAITTKVLDDKSFTRILAVALFCGLLCYLGCSLVESCYPHPITLFFACLGFFRSVQLHKA